MTQVCQALNDVIALLPLARLSSSDDLLAAVELPFPLEPCGQYGEIRSQFSACVCMCIHTGRSTYEVKKKLSDSTATCRSD